MKRIALVAAVLVLAGCTKNDETPVDTGAAMAPAPAAMDTGMKMLDSTAMKDPMMKDSLMRDNTAKAYKRHLPKTKGNRQD
jgi:PBP1b-binding outer membrane lipoprotein LpoB